MLKPWPLQAVIFEGQIEEARDQVRALLGRGFHPVLIVREAIIPAVEQCGETLAAGRLHACQFAAFGNALQGVLEEVGSVLGEGRVSLRFGVGKVHADAFNLWQSLVRSAFERAGFNTYQSLHASYCDMIVVCGIVDAAMERMKDSESREVLVRGRFGGCEVSREI